MTITHLIAIVGIAMSAFVALTVAYLHRKQMRQVELFKINQSVGLIPPPNKLTQFVKSKWDIVFAYGGPLYILIAEMIKDAPVTRMTIALVSLSLVMLALNVVLALFLQLNSKINERITGLLDLHEHQRKVSEKIIRQVFPDESRA